MKLQFRFINVKNDYQTQEDLELLKKILRKNGINMIHERGFGGEDTYTFSGSPERIAKKMSRGAGAKSKTKDVKIETIIQMEKECYRKPKERKLALGKIGIGERRYEQIKREICLVYGSLDEAIKQGYLYFVIPKNEGIKNFGKKKKQEKEGSIFADIEIDDFKKF